MPKKAQKKKRGTKLNAAAAKSIRALYAKGHSQRAIAVRFGVSRSCIFDVTSGRTWNA